MLMFIGEKDRSEDILFFAREWELSRSSSSTRLRALSSPTCCIDATVEAPLRPVIEAPKMREGERPRAYHISLLTPLFSGRLDGSSHAPRALPPCLGSSIHASSDLTPPTADHGNTGIMHNK